jgi:hypothetical protein
MRTSVAFKPCQQGDRLADKVHIPAFLLLFSLVCGTSAAGEVLELSVTKEDGEYVLLIAAVVNAPENYVFQVLTDYKHVYRINPTIIEVDVQDTDRNGVVRVRHQSEHNIGPFCFSIDWVGDIVETRHGHLEITTQSNQSSFSSGFAIWVIKPQGDSTWVLHESKLKPKFFIPPIIGDYFLKRHIRESILTTFNRIECHAQIAMEHELAHGAEYLKGKLQDNEECNQRHGYGDSLVAENQ